MSSTIEPGASKEITEYFSSLPLSSALSQVIAELGFTKLTPIQAQSIPRVLEGRDLVGQSKTGSGKTAAFALPILQKIELQKKCVQALVICPTRELCTQVAREIRKFGRRHAGLQVLILSGGQPLKTQVSSLKHGIHIVAGTPGRILDHLRRETLDLSQVFTLVLDEADRMLDMGFKEDIGTILSATPKKRQTLFFSATYPASIAAMSRQFQRDPVRVTIEEEELPDILQTVFEVPSESKFKALLCLLQKKNPESALIFCNLKLTVTQLTALFLKAGVSADCIHGELEQSDRDRVMAKFRNQSTRVLIATDVAARGLDIKDLDLVVNFDVPASPDVYVHRIGRTGRAGQKGVAISLVTPREWGKFENIERYTGLRIEKETLDLGHPAAKSLLIFESKMDTLYIAGGRKEKMRPGDILGALTGEAGGLKGTDVGKIEIHDKFAYVAISKKMAPLALERLSHGRIKGHKVRVERVR